MKAERKYADTWLLCYNFSGFLMLLGAKIGLGHPSKVFLSTKLIHILYTLTGCIFICAPNMYILECIKFIYSYPIYSDIF